MRRCEASIDRLRESIKAPYTPINEIVRPSGMNQRTFDRKLARLRRLEAKYKFWIWEDVYRYFR